MAVNDAYFSHVEYQDAAQQPQMTASQLAVVDRQALTISRFVERLCGQWFNKDAAPVVHTFPSDYERSVWLDEGYCPGIANTTGLVVTVSGVNLVLGTDFHLLPLNAATGPEPRPYTQIELLPYTAQIGSFVSTTGFFDITAVWGWPAVPSALKDMCIEFCRIWRGESPRSTGRMNELEQVVNTSDEAKMMLERIRKAYAKTGIA